MLEEVDVEEHRRQGLWLGLFHLLFRKKWQSDPRS